MRDDFTVLSAFLAVAEERSFVRGAKRVNLSPSAVSHAIRGLEERLGVRVLARTTRSVAPTEAGQELISRLRPAVGEIQEALTHVSGFRGKPTGRVRVRMPRLAAVSVLAPKLGLFARQFPDVTLDITTDDSRDDLVGAGFDAGINLGEYIGQGMVAVRVSGDFLPVVVGSPDYFRTHPEPKSPRDLTGHRCINFRYRKNGIYRWEFAKGSRSLAVSVNGPLVVDDVDLLIRAAIDGVGLTFTVEQYVKPLLKSGALIRVLSDWCQPFQGYFLYYPSRSHQPAPLEALIKTLRAKATPRARSS